MLIQLDLIQRLVQNFIQKRLFLKKKLRKLVKSYIEDDIGFNDFEEKFVPLIFKESGKNREVIYDIGIQIGRYKDKKVGERKFKERIAKYGRKV